MFFYLRKKLQNLAAIYLDVRIANLRVRASSGFIINKDDWDEKNQKVLSKVPNALKINRDLALFKSKIDVYVAEQHSLRVLPTQEEMKLAIDAIIHPDKKMKYISHKIKKNSPSNFFGTFENWIEKRKSSNLYSESRIKRYTVVYNHLKAYEAITGNIVAFASMDKDFEENFNSFLIKEKKLVNNSIGSIFKALKTFLNDVQEKLGNQLNPYYKKFQVFKDKQTPTFALTIQELNLFENVELDSKRLSDVRDLFLLQTYLLVRVSDLMKIRPENINKKKKVISLTLIKSHNPIAVPINNKCIEILEKWNYNIPIISNQKYNKNIKIIAQKAGIDDLFEVVRYSGSNRIAVTKPKYELISSHTARRTGITLLIEKRIPIVTIMKITGQKSIDTIMSYERLTQSAAVEVVRNAWDS